MQNPTLVVLTDSNDLDDQLFGQFQRCVDLYAALIKLRPDRASARRRKPGRA